MGLIKQFMCRATNDRLRIPLVLRSFLVLMNDFIASCRSNSQDIQWHHPAPPITIQHIPIMNLSVALHLVIAVGSAAATATQSSNNNDKEEIIRNLLDIPYDSSEYSDIVSSTEYASLVSSRIETTNYWTSERLSTVQPYDRTINDDDNSEEYDEDNDIWFKKRRNNNNNNSNKNLRNGNNKHHNKKKKKNKQHRNLQSIVDEGPWNRGGDIKDAAGRLMFTHGTSDYLCSATAVTNPTTGRSVIITAAHCVYDDAAKKVCRSKYWINVSYFLSVSLILKVLTSFFLFLTVCRPIHVHPTSR